MQKNLISDLNTLYVGNIFDGLKTEALRRELEVLFSKYGELVKITIFTPNNKKGKAYAFVCFLEHEGAKNAKKYLQYSEFYGLPLRILFKDEEKNFKPYSNVQVENLPSSFNMRNIHDFFEQFGDVACVTKIDKKGFIQYYDPDNALRAVELLNNTFFEGQTLKLSLKDGKPPSSKNIYFKNLPKNNYDAGTLLDELKRIFEGFGKINSLIVDKYHGFVSYEELKDAERAISELTTNAITLQGSDEPLYVNWSQSKGSKEHAIFLKDLRVSVVEAELKKCFELFGKISSISLKDKVDAKKLIVCKLATIVYSNESDMNNAIQNAAAYKIIQDLFIHNPFIVVHESKEEREKNIQQQQEMQNNNQYFIPQLNYEEKRVRKPLRLKPGATSFIPSFEESKSDPIKETLFDPDSIRPTFSENKLDKEYAKLKIEDDKTETYGEEVTKGNSDEDIEMFREKVFQAMLKFTESDTVASKFTAQIMDKKLSSEVIRDLLKLSEADFPKKILTYLG